MIVLPAHASQRFILRFVLLFFLCAKSRAQSPRLITGAVVDASQGNALPYVSIALKKNLSGTISNEGGRFELLIPEGLESDTLQIIAFGYKPVRIPVNTIEGPLSIRLQENTIALKEIEVRPLPPEFYVRQALQRFRQNYSSQPFQSLAYYREKILENKDILQFNEGVFKTYCPNYADSSENQDQVLLYRKEEHPKELQFMKKEREKAEAKEKKSGKKSSTGMELDMANSFSGPSSVLSASKLNKENASYLDTAQLKEYQFKFARPSTFDQSDLMVIEFKSKGKVDHVRESGKLFIDRQSLAIVRIESAGDFVIPVLVRPLIFLYGLGISNPEYTKTVSFRQIGGRWYPEQVFNEVRLELTKRHLFSKNDKSHFEIEQTYIVNQIRIKNVKPIPPEFRIDSEKDIEKSIHNDEGLRWDQVNKF